MGVTNLIYNDDTTRVAYDTSQAKYANFQPSALANLYLSNATSSGYSYMNNQANTWLICKANSDNGYTAVFGWTFPLNKDIYIRTDQNDGNIWFWWDGLTDARTEFGTNCTYYKEIKANNYGGISNFAASTAINCHSGWSNSLVIDGHTYWSQTWAGSSNELLPIVYTWASASRTYINGEIMAPGEGLLILDFTLGNYGTSDRARMYGLYTYGSGQGLDFSHLPPDKQGDVLPIYNNGNVNKYYDYVSGSTEKKVYNSAVLNISSGIYYMLIGDIPFAAYQKVGSSSTVYAGDSFDYRYTKNGIYISGNANGCIFGNWNTFVYTKGFEKSSYQTLEFNGSDLPVFTDPEEYMNYILNPYNPEPTGDAEVRVSYVVPDDEYTYCNITWKMNSEPEDKDDGHTATLLKDESVINITNLVEGARYIFKIFTNKSESEPFPYTVGEAPEVQRDIADLSVYDDVSVYDSSERWEYTINFYDYRPEEDYTRSRIYTKAARWGYERLQCPLILVNGKTYRISFTYYTGDNVQISQSWGKWVLVSAESGDTVHYPTDLTMRGGVQISAGRQTTNYSFTFVAGVTNYLIFDFSADKDLTGYYEYFERIKIEEVT